MVSLWFGFPFFKKKSLIFVFRFAHTCLFAYFIIFFLLTCLFHRSFFLLHSFSAFKYHISYIFNFLFLFFHCLSTFPLIYIFFVLPFCFIPSSFLFFLIRSCDLISFDLIWDFLPVSRSLRFVFPLFFFFSCWLSSTYDLIWIFVAFLTATGVVSLKSDFAIQYRNCNFIIRYLNYSACTVLHCRFFFPFFYSYLFFILFFVLLWFFLAWQFYTRTCHKGIDHIAANRSRQDSASPVRWSVISFILLILSKRF